MVIEYRGPVALPLNVMETAAAEPVSLASINPTLKAGVPLSVTVKNVPHHTPDLLARTCACAPPLMV